VKEATFTSSTNDGNPPIAMKVKSATVYIITSHRLCEQNPRHYHFYTYKYI
jgi:hypothetical protein